MILKSINNIAIWGILGLVLFAGCRKEELSSNKTLLTKNTYKNWYLSGIASSGDLNSSIIQECQKDDYWRFADNGTWLYSPSTKKCDEFEIETTGKWSFSENDKKIVVSDDSQNDATMRAGTYDVIELAQNKLVIEGRGQRYTMTCGCK